MSESGKRAEVTGGVLLSPAEALQAAGAPCSVHGSSDVRWCAHAGASMNPTLSDKDLLEVVPCPDASLRVGDVIVFRSPDQGALVVHRVLSIRPSAMTTQGDNNSLPDPWPVTRDSVVGRVVAAWRGSKRREIAGGRVGQARGIAARAIGASERIARPWLHPVYNGLADLGVLSPMLPRALAPKVVRYHGPGRDRAQLMIGRRVVGRFDASIGRWTVDRPYRLFVDRELLTAPPRQDLIGIARAELGLAPPPDVRECRDWPGLLRLARCHGMTPALLRWAMPQKDRLDATTVAPLVAWNRQNVVSSLLLCRLLHTVARVCEEQGIPCLFWKGPALAAQLYGDPAARQYGDVDLLVPPGDVLRLHRALIAKGFRPLFDLTEPQLRRLLTITGENCYFEGEHERELDVHWSLVTPRLSFGGTYARFAEPRTTVRIDGMDLPCPSPERHLVMLAIHGCKHAWSQMSWVLDMARLCLRPGLDWASVWQVASVSNAERMVSVAIDVCERVFEWEMSGEATSGRVRSAVLSRAARACAEACVREEPSHRLELPVFAAVMPGARNRAAFFRYLFVEPTTLDFELVRLPQMLYPLYYAVRPVRMAGKRLFGVRGRRGG